MPRVTIITATYNYSSVLRYAIQSSLAQTFGDFEHLIIGDGCTDDSGEVVASFNDPRLHWRNLAQNSGSQSAPNNAGLAMARGEYIAYLGHDDLWHPSHLAALVKTLDESGAEWAHPLAVMIGPPGSDVHWLAGLVPANGNVAAASFLTSGVMHRRSLVDKLGFWKDYRTLERGPDNEYHQRAVRAGVTMAHVDNLSVFKFPSAWRKNVYRLRPSDEQARYWQRMQTEPDFIERELIAIARAYEFKTWESWLAVTDAPKTVAPTAPRGALVEAWRRYRGLTPNELTPRAWWEVPLIRSWRGLADVTRPLRVKLRQIL